MSHNLTLPEEIELVLMELDKSDKKNEKETTKSTRNKDQFSWHAGYIPPYRAAYQNNKDSSMSES